MNPAEVKKLNKILWLDLEMTGLIPEEDCIIEVATIVTDKQLNELAVYENVIKQPQDALDRMDPWNQKCHRKSGLYDKIKAGIDLKKAEKDLLFIIDKHFNSDEAVTLAGNCIYQDRNFIRRYMTDLDQKLHYRMLDVTAWKIFFESEGFVFEKENRHRALEDTRDSIKEFSYYLKNIEFSKEEKKL